MRDFTRRPAPRPLPSRPTHIKCLGFKSLKGKLFPKS